MGNSVIIRTPMPSADKVADNLGMSKARREFLSELASTVKGRDRTKKNAAGASLRAGRSRSAKKAA